MTFHFSNCMLFMSLKSETIIILSHTLSLTVCFHLQFLLILDNSIRDYQSVGEGVFHKPYDMNGNRAGIGNRPFLI